MEGDVGPALSGVKSGAKGGMIGVMIVAQGVPNAVRVATPVRRLGLQQHQNNSMGARLGASACAACPCASRRDFVHEHYKVGQ